ncbi:MAG: OmpA family protein [Campylobacterota bacterium]|nr:OmpA family protein [Campylobacterota bacterium]
MKKIWPLLFLLLLLILFCLWTKKDSIHVTAPTEVTNITHANANKNVNMKDGASKEAIEFKIVEKNKSFVLNGHFKDTQQQKNLVEIFSKNTKILQIDNTTTSEIRGGDEALTFTHALIPHFLSHYKNGMLQYQEGKLTIDGDIDSYKAQHEMQRLLMQSNIPSLDNGSVALPLPMTLTISKAVGRMYASGNLENTNQITALKNKLPKSAHTTEMKVGNVYTDKEALKSIDTLLPTFVKHFHKGGIRYQNEALTIYGATMKEEAIEELDTLIKTHHLSVNNHARLDTKAIESAKKEQARVASVEVEQKAKVAAEDKAEEEAKAKAKEAEKKEKEAQEREAAAKKITLEKAQSAEMERLAALEAEKNENEKKQKVLEEAQEATKLAAVEAEKQKTQREQEDKEKIEKRKNELERKINTLLALDNIEFTVNKSTLSSKGNSVVSKLASILKQYPSIKIEIAGHTDSDGSAAYNQKLSQTRVDEVKKSLIAKSIAASRLLAVGYGETKPLVQNNSDENKAKNRRVEINIQGE